MISKNLVQRLLVAALAIPAIVWICYQGGYWLQGFLLVMVALGSYEYFSQQTDSVDRAARAARASQPWSFWLSSLLTVGIAVAHLFLGPATAALGMIAVFLVLGQVYALRRIETAPNFYLLNQAVWGVCYLSLLYPFVYHIRALVGGDGFYWVILLLATLWIGDTAAMFVGGKIGKRRLAPTVSPNKTIAGFVAGLAAAPLVGLICSHWLIDSAGALYLILAALVVSLTGQLGDLTESLWKRSAGIKDSSRLIPGHGGVLDRFDSLAFAAPALYAFLTLVPTF